MREGIIVRVVMPPTCMMTWGRGDVGGGGEDGMGGEQSVVVRVKLAGVVKAD